MKDQIIKSLEIATGIKSPHLEFSSRVEFGDYTTNVAIQNHLDASEIVEKLKKDKNLKEIVEKIEAIKPGFVNFHLSTKVLTNNLSQIIDQKEKYGHSTANLNKKVIVDYSAPNIAKPFGIGHLRSTIIGQALYNLYKFVGYEVIGDNHLGDWGTQFGKLIYMIDIKDLDPKNLTIEDLEKLYIEFHQLSKETPELEEKARSWFKKLEDHDKYAREIWETCVKISLQEFNRIYDLLGVKIDNVLGESFYEDEMKKMLQDQNIKNYLKKGENGALVIDLSKFGIKVPLMFVKSDGATTYAARDLATIKYRVEKWDPQIIIYEVSVEQKLHFEQVFAAARLLNLVSDKTILYHTNHGWYLGPDGKKFSTRAGKTIKLEEVLNEAIQKAKEFNDDEEIAKKVGVGAIKYYDLMRGVKTDVVFDWDKILTLEGNSGPYLQYTFARTQSVLSKSQYTKYDIQYTKLNSEELIILRHLIKFPEIIKYSAQTYSPNILCEYLYSLAQKYNGFYNKYRILGNKEDENWNLEIENFRLCLTASVAQILKTGLNLLGIEAPGKM